MPRVVLISGLIPYDSGKTWFTLSSALYARSLGLKVKVFKPVAGHNLWYSPRTIKRSVNVGLLLGNDATMYYENSLMDDPAIGNPMAIATTPPDPLFYNKNIEAYLTDIESVYASTVVSRITDCSSKVIKHYYYPENLEKTPTLIRKAIKKLISVLRAEKSSVSELIKYLESVDSERNINMCLNILQRSGDLVFVESFNDAISPCLSLLNNLDAIVIVAPGRVLVYWDVNTVRNVVIEQVKRHGWEGLRARRVVANVTAQLTLSIGLVTKPRPQSAHVKFVSELLKA